MEHVSNALASISDWGLQQWAIVAAASLSVYAIKRYYNGGVCHERRDLTNQVVVITGANRGIGFETAVALADMNATVVLACRSGPAVDKAIQAIRARTPRGVVTNVSLDLASLDSVRECVKELVKRYASIDILINNAGVMACPEWRTEDGHEYQFGVNHLGHFYLTNKLLASLETPPSLARPMRVVVVSSLAQKRGTLDFDDLDWVTREYSPSLAYQQSKLANVVFANELTRRRSHQGVFANSLHPGVVRTGLGDHMLRSLSWPVYLGVVLILPLFYIFTKSEWYGAQTSIYCAVSKKLERVGGRYYSDCAEAKAQPLAYDAEVGRRLWEHSERLVGESFPVSDEAE